MTSHLETGQKSFSGIVISSKEKEGEEQGRLENYKDDFKKVVETDEFYRLFYEDDEMWLLNYRIKFGSLLLQV